MNKKMLNRVLTVALAIMMLALALAGCGAPSDSGTTAPPADTAANGRVIRMTTAFGDTFDPASSMDSASCEVIVNLYDSLVYPDLDGTILNGVAADYTISEDGLVYTFTLKDGVKFHDGSDMTAQDVEFSYNRMITIGQGYTYLFQGHIESVKATDDKTVVITLTETFAPILNILCRLYIVNEDVVMANIADGDYGEFGDYGTAYLATNDAGSGAYYCESYIINDRITMKQFDQYHGTFAEKAPETVIIINGTEAATVRTMMANGELEISDQWQTFESYKALGELENIETVTYGAGQMVYLMMNTRVAPMDDVHVRKAIAYLIDYEQVYTTLFPGYLPTENYVGARLAGSDVSTEKIGYNMDKALEEIKASKYADALLNGEMAINVAWVSEVPDEEKLALLIQASASQIGLKVEVNKVAWATQVQNTASMETTPHCNVCYVSPDYGEAGSLIYQRLSMDTTGTWQQTEWLEDAELNAKISKALATLDTEERYALYDEIQSEALDNVYGIPVTEQGEVRAYANHIVMPTVERNLASTTLGYNYLFKDFQVLDK